MDIWALYCWLSKLRSLSSIQEYLLACGWNDWYASNWQHHVLQPWETRIWGIEWIFNCGRRINFCSHSCRGCSSLYLVDVKLSHFNVYVCNFWLLLGNTNKVILIAIIYYRYVQSMHVRNRQSYINRECAIITKVLLYSYEAVSISNLTNNAFLKIIFDLLWYYCSSLFFCTSFSISCILFFNSSPPSFVTMLCMCIDVHFRGSIS